MFRVLCPCQLAELLLNSLRTVHAGAAILDGVHGLAAENPDQNIGSALAISRVDVEMRDQTQR